MSVAWLVPKAALDARSGRLRIEVDVRNQSGETWRASEGFAIGYQLFDAETGTLLVDGARTPPEQDIEPGGSAPVRTHTVCGGPLAK